MNIVDAILIVILIIGVLDGVRQGVVRSVVGFFGTIVVFFLSWVLKGSLANILISHLPQLGTNSAVSVIIYFVLSFIILLIIFSIIYGLILKVTNVIEKVLDATVILGFVSKVLGGIFGLIKMYLFMFIVLFILSIFNISLMHESKVNNFILNETPLLAPMIKDAWEGIKDVYESNNVEEALTNLFEKNIINEENFEKLIGGNQ